MIPSKAVEAIHAAICEESLEDHMDPVWPGRCVKAAQAATPHLMAQAFDEGQKSGLRQADRLVAAAKIGRSDLPGPPSPNPYRKDTR